jgi:hypothetical protein
MQQLKLDSFFCFLFLVFFVFLEQLEQELQRTRRVFIQRRLVAGLQQLTPVFRTF